MSKNSEMEVGMGQIRKAKETVNQYTTHLKPCLGLGFYNQISKESYMLHYPDLSFYNISEDIKKIKNDLGKEAKVYAAGGSLNSEETESYNNSIIEDRKTIENLLYENFKIENITLNWSSFNETANLYLDKNKNKFILTKD